MKNFLFSVIGVFLLLLSAIFFIVALYESTVGNVKKSYWDFRSIDTMKYSRDVAREKLKDKRFDVIIDRQVKQIADTGATHVGIATPYDDEFAPYLDRWVAAARKYNLKIWFRGNWSGWEEWFEYPRITRAEHMQKTEAFILSHASLFEDGDIFSPCPECENGGPGDPRSNGDAAGHKKFLIDEYHLTTAAFEKIGKKVATNYNSMNGDVARLIMDRPTTAALGGLVVVDHYVGSPEQMKKDVLDFALRSGGKVVLGEFGAPIPDINGEMTEEQQAQWLKETLQMLIDTHVVAGLNYWTSVGSSTELWDGEGNPRKAVVELTKVYTPFTAQAK